jgi:hypothetical protein
MLNILTTIFLGHLDGRVSGSTDAVLSDDLLFLDSISFRPLA